MILPDPWMPFQELIEMRTIGLVAAPQSGTIVATNNDAHLCPVFFPCDAIIYALRMAGTNTTGNYDIGFYDENLNRLVSKGSTAMANAILELSIPNYRVVAGRLYYAAFSFSNTGATIVRMNTSIATQSRAQGYAIQASAHPLPNPFVPASAAAYSVVPIFAFGVR